MGFVGGIYCFPVRKEIEGIGMAINVAETVLKVGKWFMDADIIQVVNMEV